MSTQNNFLSVENIDALNQSPSKLSQKRKKTLKNQEKSKHKISKHNQKKGNWTISQQKLYLLFIRSHLKYLRTDNSRKNQIYNKMSKYIDSRSNVQCTSHHQKMLKKHGTIQNIIQSLNFLMAKKVIKSTAIIQQVPIVEQKPDTKKEEQSIKTPSAIQDDDEEDEMRNEKDFSGNFLMFCYQSLQLQKNLILKQEPKFKQWEQIQAEVKKTDNLNLIFFFE